MGSAATPAPKPKKPAEKNMAELYDVVAKWQAAWNAHSLEEIMPLYHPEATLMPPGSPVISGADDMRTYMKAGMDAGVWFPEFEIVEIGASGSIAFVRAKYVESVPVEKGKPPQLVAGKYLAVLRRTEDKKSWRFVVDSWSSDEAEKKPTVKPAPKAAAKTLPKAAAAAAASVKDKKKTKV